MKYSLSNFLQDGDGSITSREFENILSSLGHKHEEQNIRQMMSKVLDWYNINLKIKIYQIINYKQIQTLRLYVWFWPI